MKKKEGKEKKSFLLFKGLCEGGGGGGEGERVENI